MGQNGLRSWVSHVYDFYFSLFLLSLSAGFLPETNPEQIYSGVTYGQVAEILEAGQSNTTWCRPPDDLIIHLLCPTCALCQEYRELKNRGIDPSMGYQNYLAQQQQRAAYTDPPPPQKSVYELNMTRINGQLLRQLCSHVFAVIV
ncbi:unnamed protein product [Spirodela intermedia]|uniref:Uncharacterized protein n=1 Tax=Spirodela intermedia TaxID=51605 RepID=A0A7I8J8C3_SPIIN|nr:unnamed protein product [Spirodela intermedia]CAA6665995.1 unnamed protein product [Spirodela intermedia]